MGRVVEERQLAEEVARPEGRDDRRLLVLRRRQDDLHGAGGHDVEGVARVVLVEDRLAAAVAPGSERRGEGRQPGLVEAREEPTAPERLQANGAPGADGHSILRYGSLTRPPTRPSQPRGGAARTPPRRIRAFPRL